MSTTGPAAGWYSDPSNAIGILRWWDGRRWTAQTQPAPPTGPPSVSPYGSPTTMPSQVPPMSYGSAPGQFPEQAGQFPQVQTPSYGSGIGGRPMGGLGMGRRGTMGGARGMGGSFAQRNQASLTATAVAAVYIVIAVVTHFVLLGILPAVMCMRAFQRRETLAPLALVAAIVTIGVAVAFFSSR